MGVGVGIKLDLVRVAQLDATPASAFVFSSTTPALTGTAPVCGSRQYTSPSHFPDDDWVARDVDLEFEANKLPEPTIHPCSNRQPRERFRAFRFLEVNPWLVVDHFEHHLGVRATMNQRTTTCRLPCLFSGFIPLPRDSISPLSTGYTQARTPHGRLRKGAKMVKRGLRPCESIPGGTFETLRCSGCRLLTGNSFLSTHQDRRSPR